MMQDIIIEINQYGDFLKENVFLTNEKGISEEDLINIFDKDKPDTFSDNK